MEGQGGRKRALCKNISMGRVAICLTVSLNFNCCREGEGMKKGDGRWGEELPTGAACNER